MPYARSKAWPSRNGGNGQHYRDVTAEGSPTARVSLTMVLGNRRGRERNQWRGCVPFSMRVQKIPLRSALPRSLLVLGCDRGEFHGTHHNTPKI
jgi:hypothetical protein